MVVDYNLCGSSDKCVMQPSSKRPFDDSKDQAQKKCKMVVKVNSNICEIGVSGSQSEELIRRIQQMMQQIVEEMAPETDVQMSFRKEREFAVDWSELEVDVLVRIAENHLLLPEDFVMFSSVCRSWHRAAAACNLVKLNKKWIHDQMTWVMLTDGKVIFTEGDYSESLFTLPQVLNDIGEFDKDIESDDRLDRARFVLNLRSNKHLKLECREGYGRVCWGSAHGWIVTAGGDGLMFMFNPFTKSRVALPSFGTFRWRWDDEDEVRRHYFVTKAVLLDVGGDDDAQDSGDGVEDLRVVVFYGNDHVAIVKPGNRRWVEIEGEERTNSPLMDVTYDGNVGLIFVDNTGGLLCCSIPEKEESPFLQWFHPTLSAYAEAILNVDHRRTYIVKCGADLLMVTRFISFDDNARRTHRNTLSGLFYVDYYMTTRVLLDKYDFARKTWVNNLRRLKGVALFVGNNTSMWSHEPGDGSIYFNDDLRRKYAETKYKLGGHDCGVYRLYPNEALGRGLNIERNLYGGSDNRSGYCGPFFFKPSICVSKGLM